MFILVLKFIQLVALELNLAMTIMANVATIVNCQHLWRLQILKRVFLKLETALRHAFRHFSGFTLIWLFTNLQLVSDLHPDLQIATTCPFD